MQDKWSLVEPQLREKIEALAQEKAESMKYVAIYGTLLGLVFSIFGYAMFGLLGVIVSVAAGIGLVYASYYQHLNAKYKREVVPAMVQTICAGATYSAEGTFKKELIKASDLYEAGWGEHYKNEDTIRGKVGSTDFVYSEVKLSHIQSTGKSSTEVIDFQGFAFEADFNKHFPGHTALSSEQMHLMGRMGLSSMKHITLEDVDFNSRYRIYTTNDQEARYILSPALQQRIMQMDDTLQREAGAKELSMSFKEGRLLIMCQSHEDRFEVKYKLEEVRRDFMALCCMLDIIEQLNLNLRIWTKE